MWLVVSQGASQPPVQQGFIKSEAFLNCLLLPATYEYEGAVADKPRVTLELNLE
jgi:hypothetical protein